MKNLFKGNIFSKVILIISIIFSLFLICGYAITKTSTINVLFYNPVNIIVTILIFCLFVSSFYIFIYLLYCFLDNLKYKESSSKVYNFIFEKHPFLIPFIIFFIVGIPFIIYFYPGTVQWDGMKQIDYFYGIKNWSNHHPAFSTLIMGTCVKIGRALIDDNFGIFLYTFPQFLLSCATFSYILIFLEKIKTPKYVVVFTFLFFLLNPVWYINSYTLVKDTIFYLLFIIFFIEFIKYFYDNNNKYKLLLISLLVILFRNNGIYIVLGSFIILWLLKKEYRKFNSIFIIIIIFFQIIYNIIISSCGIAQGNVREMLSIPIQQTVRYINYYDVDYEDEIFLEKLFNSDLNNVKKRYQPQLSDPVKFMFNTKNNDELLDYFKLWGKYFIKHPDVYFDSFLENYYGYFYPLTKEYKDDIACFNIVKNKRVNTGYFDFHHLDNFKNERNFIVENIKNIRNLPIIELIFNTGFYTWVFILFIGYSIYKKKKEYILVASPLIISLLFCFVSPVNAYPRYMNPVTVCIPIFIGIVLSNKLNNNLFKEKYN